MPPRICSKELTVWCAGVLLTDLPPTHVGEMLLEEFLRPPEITQSAFAPRLGVSYSRRNDIIKGKRAVTAALRWAAVTGMSADFWLVLWRNWDLWHVLRSDKAAEIEDLHPLMRYTEEWKT